MWAKKNHDELTVSVGPRAKCQNDIPEDALGYEPERQLPSAMPAEVNPFAPPAVKEHAPLLKKPTKPSAKPARKSKAKSDEEPGSSTPGLSKEQAERVKEAQQRLRELFERMRQRRAQQDNGMDSED